MHVPNTTAARLRSSLERIVEQASELTRGLGVHRLERDLGTAIMSGADFYFEEPSAAQQAASLS